MCTYSWILYRTGGFMDVLDETHMMGPRRRFRVVIKTGCQRLRIGHVSMS